MTSKMILRAAQTSDPAHFGKIRISGGLPSNGKLPHFVVGEESATIVPESELYARISCLIL